RDDRPADAYFIARGVDDRHRDTLEAVLERQKLTLVAETDDGLELLGHTTAVERASWESLQRLGRAPSHTIARDADYP
ncbi:MAG: hypothetical protein GWN71_09960, partial [Gammaproteobacteria bacterium]|nr:hypothetical protein [Gemmatimonadota bacterium]NIU73888.1 hypothetical protein [Gammaproteobacteria bacterium]